MSDKIGVIITGGTIVSTPQEELSGVVPGNSEKYNNLLKKFKTLNKNVEIHEPMRILSENMLLSDMATIEKILKKNQYKNAIILSGTDMAARLAAYLDILCPEIKILILCNQKSLDRPTTSAYEMCEAALSIILKIEHAGTYVFNECGPGEYSLHAAQFVKKYHTYHRNTFISTISSIGGNVSYAKIKKILGAWQIDTDLQYAKLKIPLKNKFNWGNYTFLRPTKSKHQKVIRIAMRAEQFADIGLIQTMARYDKIILVGTGLGHIPKKLWEPLKKLKKKIYIVSDCVAGPLSNNVYGDKIDQPGRLVSGVSPDYLEIFLTLGGKISE